ncbi:YcdB/YcdC domain-containing protein [Paenibacillus sp.]|jgi:Zn-dependent metalloprotease|uniref:YcdB/YcdC domain-containing protein n=1 Tax=Paenibacillus sp. TaxID=58172 RepID=UPI00281DF68A|nr:YcdB/YcdC domain-containing protein [Paenibacillus sp.]MDR0267449.1 S-layer homology domain-containing protein [Paenibacillus sp.]
MKQKHSKRRASTGTSTNKVAKTVLASTIGLSLLQVPVWAGASDVRVTEYTVSTSGSSTNSGTGYATSTAASDDKVAGEKTQITKEEAVQKMIALFPILKDAKPDGSSYMESSGGYPGNENVWSLSWSFSKGNHSFGFSTNVDAITGEVLSFSMPYYLYYDDNAYYPPEITKEQAEKLAKDFIVQAASTIRVENLIPQDVQYYNMNNKMLFGPVSYSFTYNTKVNGIPSDGENFNISVDGKGRITSYYRSNPTKKYPSGQAAIALSDATAAFKKDLSLTLAYVPYNENYFSPNTKQDWRLEYIPSPYLTTMDANTGKRLNLLQNIDTTPPKTLEYTALPATSKTFIPHQGKALTSKEVTQMFADLVPTSKEYSLSSRTGNNLVDPSKQIWNLYWNKNTPIGPSDNINLSVDSDTGQLINYSIFSQFVNGSDSAKSDAESKAKNDVPAISESKAQEKAIELVGRYYPDAAKTLKLSNESAVDTSGGKTQYRFVFQQFYKDLPVYNHQVNVVLDGSGKLISYSSNPSLSEGYGKDLDALTAQVKPEDALRTYQEALGTELRYTSSGGFYTDSKFLEPKITLSYVPTFNGERRLPFLNAITGKSEFFGFPEVSSNGNSASLPSDAASHSASKDLATLLEYNVIKPDSDALLHPDAELTYGDLLVMLSKAAFPDQMNYDISRIGKQFKDVSSDSPYAQAAMILSDRGLLRYTQSTVLHPEQKLTREKLAETVVNILHYDRLAKFYDADPKVMSLSDVSDIQNKGAVEIVIKLGLMSAKDGKFEPTKAVTKADAAKILVLLAQSQGKVDTPINSTGYMY